MNHHLEINNFTSSLKRVEFWGEFLQAAHKFSNVTLVSGDGRRKATHALLLASVSKLLSSMLLEVYDTEDNLILSLPDFSMEEVEICFQAIMSGESSEEGLAKSLGISISEDDGKSLKQKFNYQNNILIRKITKPITNLERTEESLSNGKISESLTNIKIYHQKMSKVLKLKLLKKRVISGGNILKYLMTNTGAKYVTKYPKIKFY